MSFKDLPLDARPREKLLSRGAAALSDTELLAIVLRTGLAGRSVLSMAADLLALPQPGRADVGEVPGMQGFGGLAGLLQASNADLARIKGLGPAKRAEILAIMELAKRALAQQLTQQTALQSPTAVRQYIQAQLGHKRHEVFAVLLLDSQLRLIAFEELFRGTLNQTSVYPREIALRALQLHAHSVILAHNHPSGTLEPSQADIDITRRIVQAMALLDVRVVDHVIVAQGGSVSLAEKGLM
ncbi:JAB domain-containing protein [Lampropedia puyangensis]|uniref:JAB domain-containing protein n=1 Tax=Lampropedia puyangensis TaxID=1330072 RepID=A0A4S8FA16_9BURK|nr:DNA repair protein RadC [Lampropedia puyangensis]THU03811.1 JAB domain-containing protein [Lampropedia puyangensis]